MTESAHILVVDDEVSLREFLEIFLEEQGYVVSTATGPKEALTRLEAGDIDVVMSDLDGVYGWLKDQKGADAAKIGITGFCWGGNVTWMYSQHNPKLKAGVAWYGRLVGEASPNMKRFPVDGAAAQTVPVLGLYGAKDKGISLESVEKMRGELKKGKSGSEIIVYSDADHGFHADYRPMYNEKDAKEAWDKALKWFKDHGLS